MLPDAAVHPVQTCPREGGGHQLGRALAQALASPALGLSGAGYTLGQGMPRDGRADKKGAIGCGRPVLLPPAIPSLSIRFCKVGFPCLPHKEIPGLWGVPARGHLCHDFTLRPGLRPSKPSCTECEVWIPSYVKGAWAHSLWFTEEDMTGNVWGRAQWALASKGLQLLAPKLPALPLPPSPCAHSEKVPELHRLCPLLLWALTSPLGSCTYPPSSETS